MNPRAASPRGIPTPAPIAVLWLLLLGVADDVVVKVREETTSVCVRKLGNGVTSAVVVTRVVDRGVVDIVGEAVEAVTPIVVKTKGFPLNRKTPTPLSQSQKLTLSVQQYVSEVLLMHLMTPAPPFGLSALLSISVVFATMERELRH